MTIRAAFKPQQNESAAFKKGKVDVYAILKYKMFPELEGEFRKADFNTSKMLFVAEDRNGTYEYELEFELPYGTIDVDFMWDNKGKPEEEMELKPLPENEKDFYYWKQEPVPISMEELRQMHI